MGVEEGRRIEGPESVLHNQYPNISSFKLQLADVVESVGHGSQR